jgi:hypothetical protein
MKCETIVQMSSTEAKLVMLETKSLLSDGIMAMPSKPLVLISGVMVMVMDVLDDPFLSEQTIDSRIARLEAKVICPFKSFIIIPYIL